MALRNLKKRLTGRGYEYTETIADGDNGNTILIPGNFNNVRISCTLIAGSNTGKFQFTTSLDTNIKAGTETWQDWPLEDSTGTVSDSLISPVTGLRGVSVSGEVTIEVVI